MKAKNISSKTGNQLLCRLGVVMMLVFAVPGNSAEMPFSSDNPIFGSFDGASSVLAVDMDCDGDLDVVASARWDGSVNWWEIPGGELHVVASGFTEAYDIATGDFNGDGYPDLAGAARSAAGSNVRMWTNPGPGVGGLWPELNVSDAYLTQALSVDVGDVDGDGFDDIVVAGYHSSVQGVFMFFQNKWGDGTAFQPYDVRTGYGTPHGVDLADVDGDQDLDLLGVTYGGDEVLWFENDGSVISADPWAVNAIDSSADGAVCVRGADIDGDGDLDVAVAAFEAGDLLWYENSGAVPPTWDSHTVEFSLAGAYSVEPVDLDRDGDIDLLATGRTDDAVTWWEHVGSSWYERSIDGIFDGARSAVAADLDQDGDLDVVAAADEADDVTWWENLNVHRDARFVSKTAVSTGTGFYTGVGTINGNQDGKLDIVAIASNVDDHGDVMLFLQGTTSASWTSVEIDDGVAGAASLSVADIDGDTLDDLLVSASGDNEIVYYRNYGDGVIVRVGAIATGFGGASDAEAADIDGDGDVDVVGVAETDGLIRWWQHDPGGATPWTQRNFTTLPGASAVAIGDITGDFRPDVVAVSATQGKVIWYENLGEAGPSWLWTPRTLTTGMSAPRAVFVEDFSGDGLLDIAAAASTGPAEIWLWINQGGSPPTWSLEVLPEPGATEGISAIDAVDIDMDGDIDFVGVQADNDRFIQWLNYDGEGTSWIWRHGFYFTGVMEPLAVSFGDVDSDGDPDVVFGGNDDVCHVRNRGGQFSVIVSPGLDEQVGDGEMTTLMTIIPVHTGRGGDLALELEWLNLGFEREDGSPMEEAELNAIVDRLYLFHDYNENGVLEIGVDPLLAIDSTIEMVGPGYVQLPVPHGQVNPPLSPLDEQWFFLVGELTDDASSASPSCFRTVHMAGGTVTALRYDLYDIDPKSAYFDSVDGGLVCAAGSGIFSDGFESGDTSAWVSP